MRPLSQLAILLHFMRSRVHCLLSRELLPYMGYRGTCSPWYGYVYKKKSLFSSFSKGSATAISQRPDQGNFFPNFSSPHHADGRSWSSIFNKAFSWLNITPIYWAPPVHHKGVLIKMRAGIPVTHIVNNVTAMLSHSGTWLPKSSGKTSAFTDNIQWRRKNPFQRRAGYCSRDWNAE